MLFPKEFIDQIRERILTSQVVGKKVMLKNKGREFSGLCPFHNEKSPSFTVNDEKEFYHCFGCGAHGNVFDFVMRTEGLSFPEAIEKLALDAGMRLPSPDPKEKEKYDHTAKLMQCAEAAAVFFQESFRTSLGAKARDYIAKRGLSAQTIEEFKIGFAPDIEGRLQQYLTEKGFTLAQMQEIGLVKNRYEMFRGRVIFPITDHKGRVIAFGGRILDKGEPKYLNSPETPIFHKRRVLFGKAIAKKPAFETGEVIVTEGYMDTISLSQAGYKNTVAPLGTALSEEHLQELWSMARTPTLCFDGDEAGKRASIRAAELALPHLKPGYSLKFVALPKGQDPDDVVRNNPELFKSLVADAKPLSEIIFLNEAGKGSLSTPEAKADLRQRLEVMATKITDKSVSGDYLRYFREKLWKELKELAPRPDKVERSSSVSNIALVPAAKEKGLRLECYILGTVIAYPQLLNDTIIEEEFSQIELSHLEIDKTRQNILLTTAYLLDGELLKDKLPEFIRDLDAKLTSYVREGITYAEKNPDAKEAWKKLMDEYYLEVTKSDLKGEINLNEDEFSKLQEKYKLLNKQS